MCGEQDSTVLSVAVAGIVSGPLRRADAGDTQCRCKGGAFLDSHAKAMTNQMISAPVCEDRRQIAGYISFELYASVIVCRSGVGT